MNKKIGIFALAMMLLGAGGSIAIKSFAQTAPAPAPAPAVTAASTQTDQNIDQKDAQGNDLETNDDATSSLEAKGTNGAEQESANDNDSDAKSEQGEKGGQNDVAGQVDQAE